jgi:threonine dehydratase
VVGVEPVGAPTKTAAREAGGPVDAEAGSIAADSLAPKLVGENVYTIAEQFVDEVVLVEDDAIRAAQDTLWEKARVVAEPGAANALPL